ncbi:MAG: NADH-quinone oxidoreductase subunit [Actinomycetota bacterium]|nr:NADH-quinone oxidoreductase subunit [Actinomycetota bacterium]MDQ1498405.1 NADH-quinone oxidoreductase subunit [Actinomycetota bacterium]MDQ1506820.1 NADH-quinone oxidoreductase subunit [Actinomycetota bacterium]
MTLVHRVLHPSPITSLAEYVERGGGRGIEGASGLRPQRIIALVRASGLRGRGGAGYSTGRKWQTVARNRSPVEPSTVVVNGAEGEPGTFKDRTILRTNPYQVIEGALIAAKAVGADLVIIALKQSFEAECARVRSAVDEITAAGWSRGVQLEIFEGPDEYLYGEESALLETIQGGYPFPRVSATFRRGVFKLTVEEAEAEHDGARIGSSDVHTTTSAAGAHVAPALVNNVETMANIPRIVARGPAWFRTVGTKRAPGTLVCTVTGSTRFHGVGEVRIGTALAEVIEAIGGGPRPGRWIKAVMSGVANPVIPGSLLDTQVSYEGLAGIGSGLGSSGFLVFDDTVDMVAVAAGIARFLGIESCGQCVPCKQDGLVLADLLAKVCRSEATDHDLAMIRRRLVTVTDRSRCYLATQQQNAVGSIIERFPEEFAAHVAGTAPPTEPMLVAELVDIVDGVAVLDERHRHKLPDWSYDAVYSGKVPAESLPGTPAPWRT